MKITPSIQAIVTEGLRKSGVLKKQLASELGVNPAWITKFYDGTLKTLADEHVKVIERVLNVKFQRIVSAVDAIPGAAVELGKLMNEKPELAGIVSGLLALSQSQTIHSIPFMTPKELIKIGAEITKIVAKWDEAADPHYAKVGLESIKVIGAVIESKSKTSQKGKK